MRLSLKRQVELENLDAQIQALRQLGDTPGFKAGHVSKTVGASRPPTGPFLTEGSFLAQIPLALRRAFRHVFSFRRPG